MSGMTVPDIPDALLVEAYDQAARKSVLAALNPEVFFGYFGVCADRVGFGSSSTFPGLDWGQSAEALLWLGRVAEIRASWDYVRSFQRPNGQLPFAILPDAAGRTPEVFGFPMPVEPRGGVFRHWCPGDPFRALAAVTFLQTADAIHRHTIDRAWLAEQVPWLQRTVRWLESLTDDRGRVGGAGFYLERPARIEYDGVTQCAVADALALATGLFRHAGADASAARSGSLRDRITRCFREEFWAGDHCVEYIHPVRGPISGHGLTDVDWAALATGAVDPQQEAGLWARLRQEPAFHYNGLPTGIASRPETYERWEAEDLGIDRHDLAAMGRVWWWEARARSRMGDGAGLVDTLRKVAVAGRDNDWYWRERYYSERTGDLTPAPANTYCEYPANLIRIVQRFLLGVTFELDGAVALAPTVPDEYWEHGFGQTLAWGGASLKYRMARGHFSGQYRGAARRVQVRLARGQPGTATRVRIDGQPSAVLGDGECVSMELPASSDGCPFEVSG